MERRVLSRSIFAALSRRQRLRNSMGPLFTNSRQYFENVVVPRPQCSAMLVLLHCSPLIEILFFNSFKKDSTVRRGDVRSGVSSVCWVDSASKILRNNPFKWVTRCETTRG